MMWFNLGMKISRKRSGFKTGNKKGPKNLDQDLSLGQKKSIHDPRHTINSVNKWRDFE